MKSFHVEGLQREKKNSKNVEFSLWGKQCICPAKMDFIRVLAHCGPFIQLTTKLKRSSNIIQLDFKKPVVGLGACTFFSDQTVVTISTGSGYIPRHTQWHTWFRHRDSFYLHHWWWHRWHSSKKVSLFCSKSEFIIILIIIVFCGQAKVELISKLAPTHIFKLFPANIWIFKFFIIMILAVKMCLDNTYGLMNIL